MHLLFFPIFFLFRAANSHVRIQYDTLVCSVVQFVIVPMSRDHLTTEFQTSSIKLFDHLRIVHCFFRLFLYARDVVCVASIRGQSDVRLAYEEEALASAIPAR